jgi:hypothetical protein
MTDLHRKVALISRSFCRATVEREIAARRFNTVVGELDNVANDQYA